VGWTVRLIESDVPGAQRAPAKTSGRSVDGGDEQGARHRMECWQG